MFISGEQMFTQFWTESISLLGSLGKVEETKDIYKKALV